MNDILNGKSGSPELDPGHTLSADHVQVIKGGPFEIYRLHYNLKFTDRQKDVPVTWKAYVDVAPGQSYVIVGGRILHEDWTIEYGDRINGTPVMKRAVYNRLTLSPQSNSITPLPLYEVVVHKAERVMSPVVEEYSPPYYGLPSIAPAVPDQGAPMHDGTPALVYLGLVGIVCFILGILLLSRAQRRARLAAKAAAAPPPA